MPNKHLTNPPTTLITGATDGIGLALAHHYQQQGHRLILVGRKSLSELAHLKPTNALFTPQTYCQVDLNDPQAVIYLETFLQAQGIETVNLLIHNAGTGYYGPFAKQSDDSIKQVMRVNLLSPISLSHTLLPYLERAKGKLVFISSVVTALPGPDYAVYTASKAAVDGLARSLRLELQNKVAVQVIHPGATRTGMHAKMGLSKQTMNWDKFPSAEKTAEQIAIAIASSKKAVTIGLGNKLLRWLGVYLAPLVDGLMKRQRQNT